MIKKPYFRILVVDKFDGVVNYEVPDKFAGVADVLSALGAIDHWAYEYVVDQGMEFIEIELVQECCDEVFVLAVLDQSFRIIAGPNIVSEVSDKS